MAIWQTPRRHSAAQARYRRPFLDLNTQFEGYFSRGFDTDNRFGGVPNIMRFTNSRKDQMERAEFLVSHEYQRIDLRALDQAAYDTIGTRFGPGGDCVGEVPDALVSLRYDMLIGGANQNLGIAAFGNPGQVPHVSRVAPGFSVPSMPNWTGPTWALPGIVDGPGTPPGDVIPISHLFPYRADPGHRAPDGYSFTPAVDRSGPSGQLRYFEEVLQAWGYEIPQSTAYLPSTFGRFWCPYSPLILNDSGTKRVHYSGECMDLRSPEWRQALTDYVIAAVEDPATYANGYMWVVNKVQYVGQSPRAGYDPAGAVHNGTGTYSAYLWVVGGNNNGAPYSPGGYASVGATSGFSGSFNFGNPVYANPPGYTGASHLYGYLASSGFSNFDLQAWGTYATLEYYEGMFDLFDLLESAMHARNKKVFGMFGADNTGQLAAYTPAYAKSCIDQKNQRDFGNNNFNAAYDWFYGKLIDIASRCDWLSVRVMDYLQENSTDDARRPYLPTMDVIDAIVDACVANGGRWTNWSLGPS